MREPRRPCEGRDEIEQCDAGFVYASDILMSPGGVLAYLQGRRGVRRNFRYLRPCLNSRPSVQIGGQIN
jgi:hypothetical protein